MATGLPESVPAWYTGPVGASFSMTSALPATAPTGKPAPMIFPKVTMSAATPNLSWAPPNATRNPVMTSSKMSSAPNSSQSSRSPCKKPAAGATTPMLPLTGSTMTQATWSGALSNSARTLARSL